MGGDINSRAHNVFVSESWILRRYRYGDDKGRKVVTKITLRVGTKRVKLAVEMRRAEYQERAAALTKRRGSALR